MKIHQTPNSPSIEASCLRCDVELVHVTTGKVIGNREVSVILTCPKCHLDHHLYVCLDAVTSRVNLAGKRILTMCGTNAGYNTHVRNGQEACPDCLSAHQAYNAGRPRSSRAKVS